MTSFKATKAKRTLSSKAVFSLQIIIISICAKKNNENSQYEVAYYKTISKELSRTQNIDYPVTADFNLYLL